MEGSAGIDKLANAVGRPKKKIYKGGYWPSSGIILKGQRKRAGDRPPGERKK